MYKAKCIKADPLQCLEVGKEYKCEEVGQNVVICGTGFALSRENFDEMFKLPRHDSIAERNKAVTGTMEVKMKSWESSPCTFEYFTINGIDADDKDFGDVINESEEQWTCECFFKRKPSSLAVLDKYHITEEEYQEVCDQLDDAKYYSCGMCV